MKSLAALLSVLISATEWFCLAVGVYCLIFTTSAQISLAVLTLLLVLGLMYLKPTPFPSRVSELSRPDLNLPDLTLPVPSQPPTPNPDFSPDLNVDFSPVPLAAGERLTYRGSSYYRETAPPPQS
jgi:hypothetical protein